MASLDDKVKKITLELDLENPHLSEIHIDSLKVANITDVMINVGINRKSDIEILAVDIDTIGENILDHIDRSHIQIHPKCPVCGYVR